MSDRATSIQTKGQSPEIKETAASQRYAQSKFDAYWASIHLPNTDIYLPLYDAAKRAFEAGVISQRGEDRSLSDALDEAERLLELAIAAHEAGFGDLRPKPEWRVRAEAFVK